MRLNHYTLSTYKTKKDKQVKRRSWHRYCFNTCVSYCDFLLKDNKIMKTNWINLKKSVHELKVSVERDLVIRRYQKWMHGEVPFEDRLVDSFVKFRSYFLISWRR